MDIKAIDHVDSVNNRQRVDIYGDFPKIGKCHMIKVMEYDEDMVWWYIPKKDLCVRSKLHYHVDLKDMFDKMKDPKSGILNYKGMTTPEDFCTDKYYTFKVESECPAVQKAKIYLYFSTENKELKYILIKESELILEIVDGFTERHFKDEEFLI